MKTKAVIDRFEGDKAVLLVGKEQDRLIVARNSLPKSAKEGDWLSVDVRDDRVISAVVDTKETEAAKKRIKGKLDQLRKGDHKK